jgi:tetratricopeptide (TPR) repeat protein
MARAAPYLNLPAARLDATGRRYLRDLCISEQDLGNALADQDDPACLDHYRASYDLAGKIGDTAGQATQASNLGNTYLSVPGLRDLDQAQHWHQRSLDLKPEEDRIGRAASYGSLANVASQRLRDARAAGAKRRWYRRFGPLKRSVPDTELRAHLDAALAGYQQALELLPAEHHDYRAVLHKQLGNIYTDAGDFPQALSHFQQSLHHREFRGDTYGAGRVRYNIALLYDRSGSPGDALLYARAALADYRDVGPSASAEAEQAQALIDDLERPAGG